MNSSVGRGNWENAGETHLPNVPSDRGNMKIDKHFKVRVYSSWDHEVYLAMKSFIAEFGRSPNILLTTDNVSNVFQFFMNRTIRAQGLTNKDESLGSYACELGEMEICIDNDLEAHKFVLIFDDEAEFVNRPESMVVSAR